jgi:hypothetical protein
LLRRHWRIQADGDLVMIIARTRGLDYAFSSLVERQCSLPPCGWGLPASAAHVRTENKEQDLIFGFCSFCFVLDARFFYRPFRLGVRTGIGTGTGFCGTSSCSSSFFKRPSIGLTFG